MASGWARISCLLSLQIFAQRIISVLVLLGFLLVDLGAPKLEALLFSVVSACFVLVNSFLDDLSDPFGGSWNVEPARQELTNYVDRIGSLVRLHYGQVNQG